MILRNKVTITYIQPTAKTYSSSTTANSFRITEIITNWNYDGNGYYRSSWYESSNNTTWPDDRHDLLAFTVDGVTFSTGVNDVLLTEKGISFDDQTFKAYSTNGITGNPHGANYLAMADLIDGVENGRVLNDLVNATVYDVIIDGKNGQGLDLGTGITNFNKEASIKFFSGNGVVGAVNDNVPDLVLTQMAQAGGTDIYYYADINGNVVGKPIKLSIGEGSSSPILFNWYLDLYRMNTSVPYDISYPAGASFNVNEYRPYRMIAFELEDFQIIGGTDAASISSVNHIGKVRTINMQAGGTADVAFMAYNKSAFNIKSPEIDQFPVSRNVCKVPSNTGITFSTEASIDDPAGIPEETITYQWYKNFEAIDGATLDSYTLANVTSTDLSTYKVRVKNSFGSIDLPVTLSEGGTPTYWNGTTWDIPSALSAAGISVADADRKLIFNENYNESIDLEGCDCLVLAEKNVIIPENKTLKLYGQLVVQGPQDILDVDGNDTGSDTAPGTLVFENNASLVQTKAVSSIQNIGGNSGNIKMIRQVNGLNPNDYIYWSSPVNSFNITNIPGNNTLVWDPTIINSNGSSGNWQSATGNMIAGKGYIKRVPGALTPSITTEFLGFPRNGTISIPMQTTPSAISH